MLAHNARFAVFLLTLFMGLVWTIPPVQAAVVYVYTDETGKIHYSDYLSTIPQQYRSKARAKYVPGKKSTQNTTTGGANDSKNSKSTSSSSTSMTEAKSKKVGLSNEEAALLKEAQGVLGQMVAMGGQFESIMLNATGGRNMVSAIQSKLPLKEALVQKIGGSQEATLVSIKGFLEGSIAIDKDTQSAGAGLKTRLAAIKNRILSEAEKAQELSDKINQAIADSNAKKKAAKLKEAEEKKKKEETTQSTEEKTADKK